jgi:outer membrane protein assembly factor BamB
LAKYKIFRLCISAMMSLQRLRALCLLLLTAVCSAMFEDEAGANDWHKQQLGTITALHMMPGGHVVTSDAAVIASLDPTYGNVTWRHVLDETHTVRTSLAVDHSGLLTITGADAIARYWHAESGALLWDKATLAKDNTAEGGCVGAAASQDGKVVYTAAGSTVTAFAAASGSVQWQFTADPETQSALSAALGSDAKVK